MTTGINTGIGYSLGEFLKDTSGQEIRDVEARIADFNATIAETERNYGRWIVERSNLVRRMAELSEGNEERITTMVTGLLDLGVDIVGYSDHMLVVRTPVLTISGVSMGRVDILIQTNRKDVFCKPEGVRDGIYWHPHVTWAGRVDFPTRALGELFKALAENNVVEVVRITMAGLQVYNPTRALIPLEELPGREGRGTPISA